MKKELFLAIATLMATICVSSCKKEYSCEGCADKNKPPIAIAGADKIITFPSDSVSVDGSSSSDPDGTVTNYLWSKISGPTSFNINAASSAITRIKNLKVGTYQFELKVTDNGGLSARDTMKVIVDSVATINHPPVANAGVDQTITLPTNTITLNGSGSADPDNNISSYLWTKISGPSSFSIAATNTVQTQVRDLVEGIYQFELKVTDAGGLFSKDTMAVTVMVLPSSQDPCCAARPYTQATLTQIGNLSVPRLPTAGTAGNKVAFAGGWTSFTCLGNGWFPASVSSVVDIYDIQTNNWTIAQLSTPRAGIRSVSVGNKIFFAGGENGISTAYDNVDIYDVSTNTWTLVHLSTPRAYLATAVLGNKVFFGGGYYYTVGSPTATPLGRSNIVDIYDITTNQWSTATLSGTTTGLYTATALNDKVYFAGGNNNGIIDIYDNNANSWSTSNFQISWPPSAGTNPVASFSVGDNIYWAGFVNECVDPFGDISSNGKVEIRNTITNATTLSCFPVVPSQLPVCRNNEVAFIASHTSTNWTEWTALEFFPIYNSANGNWTIGRANFSFITANQDAGIVSVNNTIYVGGGSYPGSCVTLFDKVYTLSW